jgi:hypothetical protein
MRPKAKPYRIVAISVYDDDLDQWDRKVNTLRRRGFTSANRSALIRYALRLLRTGDIPEAPASGRLDDV